MIRKIVSGLLITFITFLMLSVTSCNPTAKFERQEEALILQYLASNPTLVFEQKPSGLYYLDVVQGQGKLAVKNDTAYVKYTGKFLNGTAFDSNVGTTDTLIFIVNGGYLLPGFDEGISYMHEGGKAIFLLPSNLAYGNSGYLMPSYTPILFDVELVKLKEGPGK
jgi:FKBP-type peptidyl-prolyl cis-trans isomerase